MKYYNENKEEVAKKKAKWYVKNKETFRVKAECKKCGRSVTAKTMKKHHKTDICKNIFKERQDTVLLL